MVAAVQQNEEILVGGMLDFCCLLVCFLCVVGVCRRELHSRTNQGRGRGLGAKEAGRVGGRAVRAVLAVVWVMLGVLM